MNPVERARKIREIATDPRTLKLHSQHEEFVKRMLTALAQASETFIRRFLLRHFPHAVTMRVEKFGNDAGKDIAGAMSALLQSCGISQVDYPAGRKGNRQARIIAFVRGEVEMARLELTFKDGMFSADEFVSTEQKDLVFGYDVPAVRIFFWRLCQSEHAPLAELSKRHYAIRFGVQPEATLESIDFETAGSAFFSEGTESGEQQRPPDDRG